MINKNQGQALKDLVVRLGCGEKTEGFAGRGIELQQAEGMKN